jgi:membrane-bound lytic murein transglycosylase B
MTKFFRYLGFTSYIFASTGLLADTGKIDSFTDKMVKEHGFERAEVTRILEHAQKRQVIIDKISRPAERTLNWGQYRKIFLTEKRTRQGVDFWRRNEQALKKAEQEYGVPAQIIVSIIGVETFYGRITGKDKVLDALYTLGFYYPKRSKFFLGELESFLLLTREEQLDPTKPKGSYAGAMGLGQFMPSSYLSYAVDFDGDGKRDIWNNETDAIGSVANYFARHGWRKGGPVTRLVTGVGQQHRNFIEAGMKPSISIAKLRSAGIGTGKDLPDNMLSSLIELETDAGKEFWLGLPNFYTITRYNHSNMYAMAAYQLSERIRLEKNK